MSPQSPNNAAVGGAAAASASAERQRAGAGPTAVIVGAGQAARWIVMTLRDEGFDGPIVVLGDELHTPYDRPPLSKAVLKGEADIAQLQLLPAAKIVEYGVDWRPGTAATAIDREARIVTTADGRSVSYDWLFLANGGTARTLAGVGPHPRIATLRRYEDAVRLQGLVAAARRVLVLGGGWIGLEVAASARQGGRDVTVIEAAPRLCIRTVPEPVSEQLLALHQRQGVDVRLGEAVVGVDATGDGVTVRLANGEQVEGDVLVVGIGLVANDQLAADAGLPVDNGVLTDLHGRTDDPAVFAVGDVANALQPDGSRLRVESWENAQRQAVSAARAALGIAHDPLAEGPGWFWSDQYEDNLQLLGTPLASHRIVERVVPDKGQRIWYFCDGPRISAMAAINGTREVKLARRWLRDDRYPDLDALADPAADPAKLELFAPNTPRPAQTAAAGSTAKGSATSAPAPTPAPAAAAAPARAEPPAAAGAGAAAGTGAAAAGAAAGAAGAAPGADAGSGGGDWVDAADRDEVDADNPVGVKFGERAIGIFEVDGELHAIDDICPHAMALLSQGFTDGCEVECPLHNAVFDVRSGKHLRGEPCADVATFPVRIVEGRIQVRPG